MHLLPFNLWGMNLCVPQMGLPHIDPELEKVIPEVGRHSCSDEELLSAPCKTQNAPTLEEMQTFIQSQKASPSDNEEIQGISFKNESTSLLDAFRELTTPLHHLGLGLSLLGGHQALNEKYEIPSDCTDVLCASKKIWGEEIGTSILYIYLKYGFNSSEYSYGHSTRFSAEEVKDVLLALADMPSQFEKLGVAKEQPGIGKVKLENKLDERPRGKRLSRFKTTNQANLKQIADATISLMPLWSTLTPAKRQYTIYHELAHNMGHELGNIDLAPEWLKLSNWKKLTEEKPFDPDEKWSHENGCFVSGYASEKPQEDFAESVTAYRYVPQRFKELCPEKYAFIKEKVYHNIEYLDSNHCEK